MICAVDQSFLSRKGWVKAEGLSWGRPVLEGGRGRGWQHCLGLSVPGPLKTGDTPLGCPGHVQPTIHCKMPTVSLSRIDFPSGPGVELDKGRTCPAQPPSPAPAVPGQHPQGLCSELHPPPGPNEGRCCSHNCCLPPSSPGCPLCYLTAGRSPSPPEQGADPEETHRYLCRRGEGVGHAASMPCCCLAAAGGGRGGARQGASWHSAAERGQLALTQPWSSAEMSPPLPAASRKGGREIYHGELCAGWDPHPTSP